MSIVLFEKLAFGLLGESAYRPLSVIISQEVIFAAFAFCENATFIMLSCDIEDNEGRERRPLFSFVPRPVIRSSL